ncbi:MAG: S8 family peptidase [Lachnospiraceae bacterium]|nr:S8 family peptidase [Lachnospiraceae bacterium]
MVKKRLVNKWLAFALSVSIMSAGMSGVAVRAEEGGTPTESTVGVFEDWEDSMDECPSGMGGGEVSEYGGILVISEKNENSESIARSKKEQKAAEKEAKKAAKEKEKEEKKDQKEQDKADKKQQKEERKLAKKLDKEKHEKTSVVNSVEDYEQFWNIVSVGSEESGIRTISEEAAALNPVKVAILDSGVDYTEDIDVYMRKNFIPGEDNISVIYEDISGHGTSVAGIIAAKDNDEGITGINPSVQLYSARILDENKQAPASRVVAAIDWAIEQDVDIINISFGTTVDSQEIHAAIKRAYDAGILIVAAAGNNGVVEYPAAYDEVIAVGAVDAKGERTEGSAIGDELELVAPGQQIISTGAFGGVCVVGGTSLAAPHVTAVASVLWQKDRSVSADFIRSLLAFTANQYGEDYEYGNGLVDLEFALSQFDAFQEVYALDADVLNEQVGAAVENGTLDVNEKPVEEFEDVVYVEGSWLKERHESLAGQTSTAGQLSGTDLEVFKLGAVAPDNYFSGMYRNSEWHGQEKHKDANTEYHSNYVFAYLYLSEIAKATLEGKSPLGVNSIFSLNCMDTNTCGQKSNCVSLIKTNLAGKFVSVGMKVYDSDTGNFVRNATWSELLGGRIVSDRNKGLYIYGLALHTITDAFAHSSYVDGERITHTASWDTNADSATYIGNRYNCAKLMAQQLIGHVINMDRGDLKDFYVVASSSTYNKTYKLGHLGDFVKAVNAYYYYSYRAVFDTMTQN